MDLAAYMFSSIVYFLIHIYSTITGIRMLCMKFPGDNREIIVYRDLIKVFKTTLLAVPVAFFMSIFINMLAGVLAYYLIFVFFIRRRFAFLTFIDLVLLVFINSLVYIILLFTAKYQILFTIVVLLITAAAFHHLNKIIRGDSRIEEEREFIESQKLKFLKAVEDDPEFRTWCYECVNFNGKYCVEGHDCEKKEMTLKIKDKDQNFCLYWMKYIPEEEEKNEE